MVTSARRASRWRALGGFLRRYARRRDGMLGAAILVFFGVLAMAPELFVGPLQTVVTATGGRLQSPTAEFPLGTDHVGREVLHLVVHGARVSMIIGFLADSVALLNGA